VAILVFPAVFFWFQPRGGLSLDRRGNILRGYGVLSGLTQFIRFVVPLGSLEFSESPCFSLQLSG